MSTYAPLHEPWHDALPDECVCGLAWKDRGLVDDQCPFHRMIEAVELLREGAWIVTYPDSDFEERIAAAIASAIDWRTNLGDPDATVLEQQKAILAVLQEGEES